MPSEIFFYFLLCSFSFINGKRQFPANFKFGVATSAYQVEGGWESDGKGENIWDRICHQHPEFIKNYDNGNIACDSYHKYKEDVAMIKALGVDYYRFSLSWARIIPKGLAGSPINQKGLEYYKNLIRELVANGIEPMVTIYHWDLPEALQSLGGWPNPELEQHFAYYARVVFDNLGIWVKLWLTFNEPMQICQAGYGKGSLAPGIQASGFADYKCTHTLLKSHALVYHMYNEEYRQVQQGQIGMVIDSNWYEPASNSSQDQEAAERILQFYYGWFAHPLFYGDYPQVMIDRINERSQRQGYTISRLPKFTQEEIEYIKGTQDFVALNTYTTVYAKWREDMDVEEISFESDLSVDTFIDEEWETESSSWLRVVPWGIRRLLNWINKTYNHPQIFITENGYSDTGGLLDIRRINFYKEYLSNVLDAIEDGANVTRYTAWSLMDNFEWGQGYTDKFGLFYVDFDSPNRNRVPKTSAIYFKIIATCKCLF